MIQKVGGLGLLCIITNTITLNQLVMDSSCNCVENTQKGL